MGDGTAGLPADASTAAVEVLRDAVSDYFGNGGADYDSWLTATARAIAAEAARQERQRIIDLALQRANYLNDENPIESLALRRFADLLEGDAT